MVLQVRLAPQVRRVRPAQWDCKVPLALKAQTELPVPPAQPVQMELQGQPAQ